MNEQRVEAMVIRPADDVVTPVTFFLYSEANVRHHGLMASLDGFVKIGITGSGEIACILYVDAIEKQVMWQNMLEVV